MNAIFVEMGILACEENQELKKDKCRSYINWRTSAKYILFGLLLMKQTSQFQTRMTAICVRKAGADVKIARST